MTAQPRWPRRWIVTDLLPRVAVLAAALAALGGAWRLLLGRHVPWLALALVVLGAGYLIQLVRFARASRAERFPEGSPGDLARRDARRFLPSILVRSVLAALLLRLVGAPLEEAVGLGLAASLLAGLVQLTRQIAIVETFRDD